MKDETATSEAPILSKPECFIVWRSEIINGVYTSQALGFYSKESLAHHAFDALPTPDDEDNHEFLLESHILDEPCSRFNVAVLAYK